MVFQCINIRQVPCEGLKTAAFSLGFQHLPRDLLNVNAWKTMSDPYITPWNTCQGNSDTALFWVPVRDAMHVRFVGHTADQ